MSMLQSFQWLTLAITAVGVVGCSSSMSPSSTTEPESSPPAETAEPEARAEYTVTFDASWSKSTHPEDFPPNPHFSGLIGGTHNDDIRFWMPGRKASDGIKAMAERGLKTLSTKRFERLATRERRTGFFQVMAFLDRLQACLSISRSGAITLW